MTVFNKLVIRQISFNREKNL